jgi:ketosteroid isomerase-like protein
MDSAASGADAATTSKGSIDVVRRTIAAYNRRDFDALRTLNHPGVHVDWWRSRGLQAGVYNGLSDVIGFFRAFLDAFDEVRIDAEEFIESGDSIIVPNVAHIRGRDGIETVARSALVFAVHSGQVTHLRLYQEAAEALERAALPSKGDQLG